MGRRRGRCSGSRDVCVSGIRLGDRSIPARLLRNETGGDGRRRYGLKKKGFSFHSEFSDISGFSDQKTKVLEQPINVPGLPVAAGLVDR